MNRILSGLADPRAIIMIRPELAQFTIHRVRQGALGIISQKSLSKWNPSYRIPKDLVLPRILLLSYSISP